MKKLFIIVTGICLLFPGSVLAYENLDELEARVSRKSTNAFYSGEDPGNYYVRQPQTVIYKDTTSGHEVMIWSQTANKNTMTPATEYGWQPWSANGARIAFTQADDPGCYTLKVGTAWYVARSDGTYWRAACESGNRAHSRRPYFDWSPTYPDVAYFVGYNNNGVSGLDQNAVYRETISDTSISYALIVDLIPADTTTQRAGGNKHAITGDGLYYLASVWAETQPWYIVQIEPSGSRQLKLSYNTPTLDTYWGGGSSAAPSHWHDEHFTGNSAHGYWIYFYEGGIGNAWRMRPWGSDNNAPDHVQDHTSSYTWWNADGQDPNEMPIDSNKEIQFVNGKYIYTLPNFVGNYWSHDQWDQWGTHVAFSDGDLAGGSGLSVWDIENSTVSSGWVGGGSHYAAWAGWTDYITGSVDGPGAGKDRIGILNYADSNDYKIVAYLHSATWGDFTHPGQSPDGTKTAMRSDWLNPSNGQSDLFIAAAYFPYPPEITQTTTSGGTVTVRFDWRLDQANPRGYTTRGWPNESTDIPPPPRETEKFRLWRSSSGNDGTWIPLGNVSANIFNRYNFATGEWTGANNWTITDSPGDGTFYYAVTAIEWSGLESHKLSNIYRVTVSGGSGSGSEDAAYPANPGGDSNFHTTLPPVPTGQLWTHKKSPATASGQYTIEWDKVSNTMVRYYNIYAEDGSAPTADQTNRIASIATNACTGSSCSWVDWLGNPNGMTQYVVTAVDYQGNESGVLQAPQNLTIQQIN